MSLGGERVAEQLHLPEIARLEHKVPRIHFAVHLMVTIDETDALDLVPILRVMEEPLTFRSLIRTTASPFANAVPLASSTRSPASSSAREASAAGHSCPQSAQT